MKGKCTVCNREYDISDEFLSMGGKASCPHCMEELTFLDADEQAAQNAQARARDQTRIDPNRKRAATRVEPEEVDARCATCDRRFKIDTEYLRMGGQAQCPHCVVDLVFDVPQPAPPIKDPFAEETGRANDLDALARRSSAEDEFAAEDDEYPAHEEEGYEAQDEYPADDPAVEDEGIDWNDDDPYSASGQVSLPELEALRDESDELEPAPDEELDEDHLPTAILSSPFAPGAEPGEDGPVDSLDDLPDLDGPEQEDEFNFDRSQFDQPADDLSAVEDDKTKAGLWDHTVAQEEPAPADDDPHQAFDGSEDESTREVSSEDSAALMAEVDAEMETPDESAEPDGPVLGQLLDEGEPKDELADALGEFADSPEADDGQAPLVGELISPPESELGPVDSSDGEEDLSGWADEQAASDDAPVDTSDGEEDLSGLADEQAVGEEEEPESAWADEQAADEEEEEPESAWADEQAADEEEEEPESAWADEHAAGEEEEEPESAWADEHAAGEEEEEPESAWADEQAEGQEEQAQADALAAAEDESEQEQEDPPAEGEPDGLAAPDSEAEEDGEPEAELDAASDEDEDEDEETVAGTPVFDPEASGDDWAEAAAAWAESGFDSSEVPSFVKTDPPPMDDGDLGAPDSDEDEGPSERTSPLGTDPEELKKQSIMDGAGAGLVDVSDADILMIDDDDVEQLEDPDPQESEQQESWAKRASRELDDRGAAPVAPAAQAQTSRLPAFMTHLSHPGILAGVLGVAVLIIVSLLWLLLGSGEDVEGVVFPNQGLEAKLVAAPEPADYKARETARNQYGLGNRRAHMGDFEGAVEEYKAASSLDPGYPLPHRAMGSVYAALGQSDLSLLSYETYLRLQPEGPDKIQVREIIKAYRSK